MMSKKEKKGGSNIAFLVSNKSTLRVRQFIEAHLEEFQDFNIIATLTEGKELESVRGLKVQYVPSLELGGCAELAQRVKRGQIMAVFVLNPGAVFSVEFKIQPLLDACWLSDTHICFNLENIELIFSQLTASHKGTAGSKGKPKVDQITASRALSLFQNQLATFDKPVDVKEKDKRKAFVDKCAVQQLEYLFHGIHHEFLPMNDLLPLFINKENLKLGKKEAEQEMVGMGKFFEFNSSGFLRLKACPLDWGLKFLTIGPEADIRKFWDYELFKRDFLITHSIYISSVDLVRGLRHFFLMKQPEGLNEDEHGDLKPALTILKLLNDWLIMEYGSDFSSSDNDDLFRELDNFIKVEIMQYDANQGLELQQLLHATTNIELPFPLSAEKEKLAPKSIVPKKIKFDEDRFFTILSPLEVARQMTLLDENYFQKILAREFLNGAWTKNYAMVKAPNLTKFINHTNRTANFIVTEILSQRTLRDIADYITFWIKVGEQFQILKNYNGVMNILTALHSSTIGRIKNAWNEVKQQDKDSFENMTDSLSLLGHFKNYREEIKKIEDPVADGPVMPLIAVTCSDLNGLGEVLENKTDEGWINFDKHQKISEHIWAIKRLMRGRYNFKPVPEIKNYIEKAEIWSPAIHGEKTLSIIAKYRNEFCVKDEVIKAEKDRHLNIQDRFSAVHSVELTDKDWDLLHSLKFSVKPTVTKYQKGDMILEIGVQSRHLYKIKKGTVRGEQQDFQQKSTVATFTKDLNQCFFGCLGLISEYVLSTFNYVAEENCEVYKYEISQISKECVSNPTLGEKLSKILCAKITEKLNKFGTTPDTQLVNKKLPIFLTLQQKNDDRERLLGGTPTHGISQTPSASEISKNAKAKKDFPNVMEPTAPKKATGRRLHHQKSTSMDLGEKMKGEDIEDDFDRKKEEPRLHPNLYYCCYKHFVGKLYVTKTQLTFTASSFGKRMQETITVSKILNVEGDEREDTVTIMFGEGPLNDIPDIVFRGFRNLHQEAFEKIHGIVKDKDLQIAEDDYVEIPEDSENLSLEKDIKNLTDEHWDLILEASKPTYYEANTIIIRQDAEEQRRIYHIGSGSCRVERELENGQVILVETLQAGDIFGESSFLNGHGSKASSTIMCETGTYLTVIEGFFLDILFDYFSGKDGLCSRFYFYIATELFKRLKNKYRVMNSQPNSPGHNSCATGTEADRNFDFLSIINKDIASPAEQRPSNAPKTSKLGEPKAQKKEMLKDKLKKDGHKGTGSSSKFGTVRDKKARDTKGESKMNITTPKMNASDSPMSPHGSTIDASEKSISKDPTQYSEAQSEPTAFQPSDSISQTGDAKLETQSTQEAAEPMNAIIVDDIEKDNPKPELQQEIVQNSSGENPTEEKKEGEDEAPYVAAIVVESGANEETGDSAIEGSEAKEVKDISIEDEIKAEMMRIEREIELEAKQGL